jgi:PKD repeat protein
MQTYWVGTPSGGVWVTYNDGQNWEVLTDENEILGVSEIVIPTDYEESKTIYIATGDRDFFDNNSIGVLKSTDEGNTWNATGLTFAVSEKKMANRLLLHPDNNNILLAATTVGVFKTIDGGVSWSKLSSYSFIDMEFKPGNPQILYGSSKSGSIYRTTNGGTSWEKVIDEPAKRVELAVSPANPEYVYAIMEADNHSLFGIYKSINGGGSFDQVYDGLLEGNNILGWFRDESYEDGGQGHYDLAIAVSPNDENVVLIGGINTWRSEDAGASWAMSNYWYQVGSAEVHADKHMLKYQGTDVVFECNDGGIYKSSLDGKILSWDDKTNGISNCQMYKLGVSQLNEQETVTGLQDCGTKLMVDTAWYDVNNGDGMECLLDYSNINIGYATHYNGQISLTTNHWGDLIDITPTGAGNGAWVTPFIIDPVSPSTLYAGYSQVWKTENRGYSWTKISNIEGFKTKIREMAICHSNNQVIWITDHYSLYKTTDGGQNWDAVPSFPCSSRKSYIAIKNNDPNTVWVTIYGYGTEKVFKTTDGGVSWEDVSAGLPPLPANTIVYNASVPDIDVIYVGTDVGVYQKAGNNDFVKYSNGLPNVKVTELEFYYGSTPSLNKLRASTYGRGLWETPVSSVLQAPKANFTATSKSIVKGNTVAFQNTSKNSPSAIKWYFNGGEPAISTEQNPIITYNSAGNYPVSLIATNSLGSDSICMEGYISVYDKELVPPLQLEANVNKHTVELSWISLNVDFIAIDEDFENDFPPSGWSIMYSEASDSTLSAPENQAKTWIQCDKSTFNSTIEGEYINNGVYSAAIDYDSPNFNWLITSQFLVKENFELRFWMWYTNNHDNDWITKFNVLYFDGSLWDTLAVYNNNSETNKYETEQVIGIGHLAGKYIQLAFVYEYNDGYVLAIDDVYVGKSKKKDGPALKNIVKNNLPWKYYRVYRDNKLLDSIMDFSATSYTDIVDYPGGYSYFVESVYGDSVAVPSNYVHTKVYPIPVANFEATPVTGSFPLSVAFTNLSTGADQYKWLFGNGVVSTQSNPTYVYNEAGSYDITLIAWNNGNSDTLSIPGFIDVIENLDDPQIDGGVKIYPNPANNYLALDFGNNNAKGSVIELISLHGEVMLQNNIRTERKLIHIPLHQLKNGVYLLSIKNNTDRKVHKIVKQ